MEIDEQETSASTIAETVKKLKEQILEKQQVMALLIQTGNPENEEVKNLVKEIFATKAVLESLVETPAPVVPSKRQHTGKDYANSEEDKALSQLQKTHPKLKFYDDSDPYQFWDSFEAALSTRLLKTHPATLLKHCLSQRSNSTAFFRDIVSEHETGNDFDLAKLKSLFMDQYAGVFWRATAHSRLFGYIRGEHVKTFLDRFSAAAHQANLDLSSSDPEMNMLKTMIVAKLPD